jgi:SPP1 gp7 family putative phage head morphogenesis protein
MTMPNELDSRALEWIQTHSLLLAREINKTTLEALRKILSDGFANGDSIDQITKAISDYFPTNEKWRAERISRTEIIRASNEGALQRYESEGFNKSEFLASPDACEECQPLNGQIYPTKEAHGIIPVHPNCRCTWTVAESELI